MQLQRMRSKYFARLATTSAYMMKKELYSRFISGTLFFSWLRVEYYSPRHVYKTFNLVVSSKDSYTCLSNIYYVYKIIGKHYVNKFERSGLEKLLEK